MNTDGTGISMLSFSIGDSISLIDLSNPEIAELSLLGASSDSRHICFPQVFG